MSESTPETTPATAAPLCEVHGTPMTLTPYFQRHTGARVDLETCDECDEQEERDAERDGPCTDPNHGGDHVVSRETVTCPHNRQGP